MKARPLSYSARIPFCKNSLAKQLLLLMDEKKTNLAFAADLPKSEMILDFAEKLGPEICILKTHVDIIDDFSETFTKKLILLAKKYRFFIFEDRKFADIGNTVKLQYQGGMYQIAKWAEIINAHSVPGPNVIEGLMEIGLPLQRGLLLLAEMSSANNLMHPRYAEQTLRMAEQFPGFVIGFISQRKLSPDPQWIYFTPGVQMSQNKDNLGQCYVAPDTAIRHYQSDIIIVGRGILHSIDPLEEAKKYRKAGWDAYASSLIRKCQR